MRVEVTVPEKFTGDITGDLSSKRGQVQGMDERGPGVQAVNAMVPLAEMFGYTTRLRSMTEGRGSATMEFDHYDVVPHNVAEEIKEKRSR